jgi:hypothetical protein
MAYTFDKANANAPSTHKTQYFEMMDVQGLYNDGWMRDQDDMVGGFFSGLAKGSWSTGG